MAKPKSSHLVATLLRLPLLAVALGCPGARAADALSIAACSYPLAKDYEGYSRTTSERVHLLRIIDDKTWSEYRRSLEADGSLLFGLVKIAGTYEQFEKNRREYFESINYTKTFDEAVSIVRLVTRDRAYAAYEKCLDALIPKEAPSPIRLIPLRETPRLLRLRVTFKSGSPAEVSDDLTLGISGGRLAWLSSGNWRKVRRFAKDQSVELQIERTPGQAETSVSIGSTRGHPGMEISSPRADGVVRVVTTRPYMRSLGRKTLPAVAIGADAEKFDGNPKCWRRSPQGDWCVMRNELVLRADTALPGTRLKEPKLACKGLASTVRTQLEAQTRMGFPFAGPAQHRLSQAANACSFIVFERPWLEEEDKTARVEFGNFSLPADVEFSAEQEAPLIPQKTVLFEQPFVYGSTVAFTLAGEMGPLAKIEYEHGQSRGGLELADQQSVDRVLLRLKAPSADDPVGSYVYQIQKPIRK